MFRNKIAGVFGAAVLLGVVAGTLAAFTAIHPLPAPPGSAAALAASGAATSTASASSATSGSSSPTGGSASPGANASPTATTAAVPAATRTPRPTPTVLPPGQGTLNNGRVVSISRDAGGVSGTFVLSVSGRIYTCVVTSSTTWVPNPPVPVTSFSLLRSGMDADVNGTMQTDGTTFVASSVSADS
jgi:hypothetical protein